MDAELHGVSSQAGMTIITRNGVSLFSDEASACRTAFGMSLSSYSGMAVYELVHRNWKEFMIAPNSMSSCSYSGLGMKELVHRNWKEFMIAPKAAFSGKAEQ